MDMSQSSLQGLTGLVAVAAGLGLASEASGAIMLSVAATPKPDGLAYQQTKDDPCVFGNNDCKSPANWAYSDTPTGNQSYDSNLWSFSDDKAVPPNNKTTDVFTDQNWTGKVGKDTFTFYTSSQLYTVLGCDANAASCGFFIGFDNNRSNEPQVLKGFDIWECANTKAEGAAAISKGCTLLAGLDAKYVDFSMTSNFGTGWSDYKFYDPNQQLAFTKTAGGADKYYAFNLRFLANDGPDSAFLIRYGQIVGCREEPCGEIPAPAPVGLMAAGLLALAGVHQVLPFVERRRRRRRA